MDLSERDEQFLSILQKAEFSEKPDLWQQADKKRNIFLQLSNYQQDDHLCSVTRQKLKQYFNIMDSFDSQGVNNYAEGSMSLCSYYKNESKLWQSSLTKRDTPFIRSLKMSAADVKEDDEIITLPSLTSTRLDHLLDHSEKAELKESYMKTSASCMISTAKQNSVLLSTHEQSNLKSAVLDYNSKPNLFGSSVFELNTLRSPASSVAAKESRQDKTSHCSLDKNENSRDFTSSNSAVTKSFGIAKDFTTSNTSLSKCVEPFEKRGDHPKRNINEDDEEENKVTKCVPFKTAKQQMIINQQKYTDKSHISEANYGALKKSLGTRRGPASKFIPPVLMQDGDDQKATTKQPIANSRAEGEYQDERLVGIDPKMIELINNEIMDHGPSVTWSDIAGLDFAKKTIKEIVVWPMLRPDIFVGLRGPPKGLLLFGPPGTGKTLIGKCVASQSKSTFFSISASSLTSKWVGEGEKMVRALFAVARCHQPAVIFIDEIDALLSQRSDTEHESSRRIKTEFLVQLDGAATLSDDRILVIGATNRPHEIDEAARRRLVKRLYIPLPEPVARQEIVKNLMSQQNNNLIEKDIQLIVELTDGYSGADMTNLCKEAAMGPIRSLTFEEMEIVTPDQLRPIMFKDFEDAFTQVRASVSNKDLQLYTDWNKSYGSFHNST